MPLNFGKMIGDIERDIAGFVRDPLSLFSGAKLSPKDQGRLNGIRNQLPSIVGTIPRPATAAPSSGSGSTAIPSGAGPITINIHITINPDGVVAGVGTQSNATQSATVVGPPPDMRSNRPAPNAGVYNVGVSNQAAASVRQGFNGVRRAKVVKPRRTTPARPGR